MEAAISSIETSALLPVAAAPKIITAANIQSFVAGKPTININYDDFLTGLDDGANSDEMLAKNSEKQNSAYRDAILAALAPIIKAWHDNITADKGPLELPPITGNRENLKASEHYKIYAAAAHIALQSAGVTKPEDIAKVQITPSSDTKEENDGLNQGMASFTKIIEDGLAADQDLSNKALEKAITIHPDRKTKYQSFKDEALKLSAAKAPESLDAFKKFLETQSSEDAVKGDTSLNIVNSLLSKVLSPKEPPSPASAEDTQKYADALAASKDPARMEFFVQDVMQKFFFLEKDPIEANKEAEAGNILAAFTALAEEHEAFKDVILAEQKKYTDDLDTAKAQILDSATASPAPAGAAVDPNAPPVKVAVDPKTKENVEKVKAAATLLGSVVLCSTAACFFPPIGVLLIIAGAAWFMNRGKGKEAKEAEEAAKLAAEEEALKAADPDRGLTAKEYLAKLEAEKAGNVALNDQDNALSLTGSAAARATNALAEELDKDLAEVIKTLTAAKESLATGVGINNDNVIKTLTAAKESFAAKKGGAFSDADTVDFHDIESSLDSALELINSDGVGVTKPSPKDLLDNTLEELEKTAKARAAINNDRTNEPNWQTRVEAAKKSQQTNNTK